MDIYCRGTNFLNALLGVIMIVLPDTFLSEPAAGGAIWDFLRVGKEKEKEKKTEGKRSLFLIICFCWEKSCASCVWPFISGNKLGRKKRKKKKERKG